MPRTSLPRENQTLASQPAAPGSLLGRERELAAVAGAIDGSRLVTLVGPPGIGKTRLARMVAEDHACRAAVVELAPVADPAIVPAALAGVLSVQESAGRSLLDAVVASLRSRSLLLLIDNCEHLIAACAETIEALLASCPRLRVLATSREPLGLAGERVRQVPPLALPDQAQERDLEALMGSAAVRLFVERAAAVQPGFELNPYVASDVAEVCRRLDGIPLAIELAAARVQALTPGEVARRLDGRFGLLTGAIARARATRRSRPRSTGATTCSASRSGRCCGGCRSSRGDSTSRRRRRCAPAVRSPLRSTSSHD